MKDSVLRTKLGLGAYCDTYMPTRLIVALGDKLVLQGIRR